MLTQQPLKDNAKARLAMSPSQIYPRFCNYEASLSQHILSCSSVSSISTVFTSQIAQLLSKTVKEAIELGYPKLGIPSNIHEQGSNAIRI